MIYKNIYTVNSLALEWILIQIRHAVLMRNKGTIRSVCVCVCVCACVRACVFVCVYVSVCSVSYSVFSVCSAE